MQSGRRHNESGSDRKVDRAARVVSVSEDGRCTTLKARVATRARGYTHATVYVGSVSAGRCILARYQSSNVIQQLGGPSCRRVRYREIIVTQGFTGWQPTAKHLAGVKGEGILLPPRSLPLLPPSIPTWSLPPI